MRTAAIPHKIYVPLVTSSASECVPQIPNILKSPTLFGRATAGFLSLTSWKSIQSREVDPSVAALRMSEHKQLDSARLPSNFYTLIPPRACINNKVLAATFTLVANIQTRIASPTRGMSELFVPHINSAFEIVSASSGCDSCILSPHAEVLAIKYELPNRV